MPETVDEFLDEYIRRYSARDVEGVTEFCHAPFLAIREGVPIHLADRDAVWEHFGAMIDAYRAGIPGNGKPFPDGAKMAKVHWNPKQNQFFPDATVPGTLLNVDFMEKDSKRFADSGGWGYAVFDYDAASDTFKPGTTAGTPPQGNDAKCGFACHTRAKARDYVFTEYGKR